jgi:hypothetical protein
LKSGRLWQLVKRVTLICFTEIQIDISKKSKYEYRNRATKLPAFLAFPDAGNRKKESNRSEKEKHPVVKHMKN